MHNKKWLYVTSEYDYSPRNNYNIQQLLYTSVCPSGMNVLISIESFFRHGIVSLIVIFKLYKMMYFIKKTRGLNQT